MARQRGWQLLLRIEDLDTPRIHAGAAASVIDTLRWLGIDWDGWWASGANRDHLVQSEDLEPYRAAMRSLASRGLAYPCQLSRSEIEAAASAPQHGSHETPFPSSLRPSEAGQRFDFATLDSPGTGGAGGEGARPNWRLLVPPGSVAFDDRFAGSQSHDPAQIIGDFVIWTRRGQPSYQLAVVVDDHRQGVTEIVRGDDLLDSAARQLLLYRLLGLKPEPTYTHLPLVVGADGRRLAKRHGDTRVANYRDRGVPAEAIIGLVARWSGVSSPARRIMSASEFLREFDLSKMPRSPVTFTSEDDSWLLSQARAAG